MLHNHLHLPSAQMVEWVEQCILEFAGYALHLDAAALFASWG